MAGVFTCLARDDFASGWQILPGHAVPHLLHAYQMGVLIENASVDIGLLQGSLLLRLPEGWPVFFIVPIAQQNSGERVYEELIA